MPAAIEASLSWSSGMARHLDRMILPPAALNASGALIAARSRLETEAEVEVDAAPWLQPAGQPVRAIDVAEFVMKTSPVPGRFYPMLAFHSIAHGPRDMRPSRLLAWEGTTLQVDPNHPLAGRDVRFCLRGLEAAQAITRMVQLFDGPGMQVPPEVATLTYLPAGALQRQDGEDDAAFYAEPRLVHHLDAACRAEIATLHGRFLSSGQRVLDLMSSWVTHWPEGMPDVSVTGLGLNMAELEANPSLSVRVRHDLNREPRLLFPDKSFDTVLCTASVEYLIRPEEVLAEVKRVLAPGGACIVTFSDRWFPPKAIRVWSELHPFERLGMVLWLMHEAGFRDMHTETLRGLKRPEDDKYAGQRDTSDPLFAVWGRAP